MKIDDQILGLATRLAIAPPTWIFITALSVITISIRADIRGITGGEAIIYVSASVLVVPFVDDSTVPLEIATMLRNQGLTVEVYLEEGKMKKKLAYADKLSVPFVVFVGEDEISSGMFAVKNMSTRQQVSLPKDQICSYIQKGD